MLNHRKHRTSLKIYAPYPKMSPVSRIEIDNKMLWGQVRYWSLTSLNITQMISDKDVVPRRSFFYRLRCADWLVCNSWTNRHLTASVRDVSHADKICRRRLLLLTKTPTTGSRRFRRKRLLSLVGVFVNSRSRLRQILSAWYTSLVDHLVMLPIVYIRKSAIGLPAYSSTSC